MKRMIKQIGRMFGLEIKKYRLKEYEEKTISLQPKRKHRGNALLSYIIEPFFLSDDESVSNAHTHDGESLLMAQTFLDLGYAVDVIDYRDRIFAPKKNYSFFVGARTNFQRIAQLLDRKCVKIVHLETSHWLFNNSNSYRRCLDLQKRREVALKSFKWVEPNWAIEFADYATIKGNKSTLSTYSYAQKPSFLTPNPTCRTYAWMEDKDYQACRNSFLWFGSEGMVHKGLDLVLEVFTETPEFHLTVCGPLEAEEDFLIAYKKELFKTPNIHTKGWVDIDSPEFTEIRMKCIGLVYPSCAEGQAGSVVTCLQAGLIPIISYESGVNVNDFGFILKTCSKNEIKVLIKMVSNLSADELRLRSRKSWEFARANHTRERFSEEYRKIIEKIINNHEPG
jgi:glycosyltransferase involved in cell wall biosynthesis